MNKIAIIGAGRVGETTAQVLAKQETCREVALLDIREDAARGAALENEYQQSDIAMGVPCILGDGGLEKVIELQLNDDEMNLFKQSVEYIRSDLEKLASL